MAFHKTRTAVTLVVVDFDDPGLGVKRMSYPEQGYKSIENYRQTREGQGCWVEFDQVPENPNGSVKSVAKFARDVEAV